MGSPTISSLKTRTDVTSRTKNSSDVAVRIKKFCNSLLMYSRSRSLEELRSAPFAVIVKYLKVNDDLPSLVKRYLIMIILI